ncbi:MAG: hypothetical protein ACK4L4_07610 [Gemmobacter sp.]
MTDGQRRADYRAACLTAGRYDLLAAEYVYPLAVYLPGAPAMLASAEETQDFFCGFHAALQRRGLTRLSARVTAEGLPLNGRARLWSDWYAEGPGQPPELVAQTICYRRAAGGDDRTEMLEFTLLDIALPRAA